MAATCELQAVCAVLARWAQEKGGRKKVCVGGVCAAQPFRFVFPSRYAGHLTPALPPYTPLQGAKLTDKAELQRRSINPRAVGLALVKLFAELTLIHGYVHGDPHPGNLMVRPKGEAQGGGSGRGDLDLDYPRFKTKTVDGCRG
jgi:hypothetical protein